MVRINTEEQQWSTLNRNAQLQKSNMPGHPPPAHRVAVWLQLGSIGALSKVAHVDDLSV